MLLEIKGIQKTYDNQEVLFLDHIVIEPGHIFCFLGANGAGKTTTIEIIAGIEKPEKGDILLDDKSILHHTTGIDKSIAYVPDKPLLYDELSGWEQLEFFRQVYQMSHVEFENRLTPLLDIFQFEPYLPTVISDYSKGMKQKLQLIGILIQNVRLYILDEPFSGLDIQGIEALKRILRNLAAQGSIVFISTHLLDVVLDIGDSGLYLKDGRIVKIIDNKQGLYQLKKLMHDDTSFHISMTKGSENEE